MADDAATVRRNFGICNSTRAASPARVSFVLRSPSSISSTKSRETSRVAVRSGASTMPLPVAFSATWPRTTVPPGSVSPRSTMSCDSAATV